MNYPLAGISLQVNLRFSSPAEICSGMKHYRAGGTKVPDFRVIVRGAENEKSLSAVLFLFIQKSFYLTR